MIIRLDQCHSVPRSNLIKDENQVGISPYTITCLDFFLLALKSFLLSNEHFGEIVIHSGLYKVLEMTPSLQKSVGGVIYYSFRLIGYNPLIMMCAITE